MHFSVPDTQELLSETTGATYTGYNIYINGSYHCCLRYKQLHALHEQLRKRCAASDLPLPSFPPKRLLPLTHGQLETRRIAIEHYLQQVGQDGRIARLETLQQFLLHAQQETATAEGLLNGAGGDALAGQALEVLLMNGYRLQVSCQVGDNASQLLAQVCAQLQLPAALAPYFGLFLMRQDAEKDALVLLRRLMDFEAPFVTRLHSQPCQILLRKCYWSASFDLILMQDAIALNLLYLQAVADIDREWIIAPPDVRHKLCALQQQHSRKREYLEMARQLPHYGCLQFMASSIDYPEPQSSALISIGNKELCMRTERSAKIYETKFRVTRMRCWRVTAIHSTLGSKDAPANLQLSFEYLMSKQSLRWVTITSAQAMIMSVCLQSMVDELLNCKDALPPPPAAQQSMAAQSPANRIAYVARNGRVLGGSMSGSMSTPAYLSEQTDSDARSAVRPTNKAISGRSPTAPVKFLTQRRSSRFANPKITTSHSYSAVFFRNAEESVQNEAFEGIGDDDL